MKKKTISKFMSVLLVLTFVASSMVVNAFEAQTQPEVLVEVYVNSHGEEYIANLQFEDGTKIGDYDYEIKYVKNPLTRDPTYLTPYFESAMWITRDGVVSLSLDPTDLVRSDEDAKDTAWLYLSGESSGMGDDANWPKLTWEDGLMKVNTFKWQYDCHFAFASSKSEWNLEPHRKASSYASVVLAACNP